MTETTASTNGDFMTDVLKPFHRTVSSPDPTSNTSSFISTETLSNAAEHSPVWSLSWDGDNPPQTSVWSVQPPPAYSWRRKESGCITPCHKPINNGLEIDRESPLPLTGEMEETDTKKLVKRKSKLLQNIALEYSKLAGLLQDEMEITGIQPKGYEAVIRGYSKAVDDYECFQIYMDSLLISSNRPEPEPTPEVAKPALQKGASYVLSPRILENINYGSLQNIVQVQEMEHRGCAHEAPIPPRNRASSTPREILPPGLPNSKTHSALNRFHRSGESKRTTPTPTSTPVSSRPGLRRFFSLKSLTDGLPGLPSSRTPTKPPVDLTELRDATQPSRQLRNSISHADPAKISDLLEWKCVEIATVENILRANMNRAQDSELSKKSRRAYRDCAFENRKTLLRLQRESEELRSALRMRSHSMSRFDCLPQTRSVPPPPPYSPSQGVSRLSSPTPPSSLLSQTPVCPQTQQHNSSATATTILISDVSTSESSSLHADELSSDSSHSSAKASNPSALTTSCHSVGSIRTFASVPNYRSGITSTPISSRLPTNDLQDSCLQGKEEFCKSQVTFVHYLLPNQSEQGPMRSYGRPNYSRHGNQVPRFYSAEESTYGPFYHPQSCKVQYASFPTNPNRVWPPTNHSAASHFNPKTPPSCLPGKPMSQLERLTNHGLSEDVDNASTNGRPRFTLADKLNMCAAATGSSSTYCSSYR